MIKNFFFLSAVLCTSSIYAQTNSLPTSGDVGIGTTNPQERLQVCGTVKVDSTLIADSIRVIGNTNLEKDLKIEGNLVLPNIIEMDTIGNYNSLLVKSDGTVVSTPKSIEVGPYVVPPCKTDAAGNIIYGGTYWTFDNPNHSIYTGHCTEAKVGINRWNPRVALDVKGTTYSTRLALGFSNPIIASEYFSLKINSSPSSAYSLMSVTSGSTNLFNLNSSGLLNSPFVQTQKFGINVDPTSAQQVGVFHIKTNLPNTNASPIFLIENQTRKLFQVNNNGHIYARQVRVNLDTAWPDYVFANGYELMPLNQLEEYINDYGHLPNVQPAEDVAKNGLDLGESNRVLTEKVEELTLYLIEQSKALEMMRSELESLKEQLNH